MRPHFLLKLRAGFCETSQKRRWYGPQKNFTQWVERAFAKTRSCSCKQWNEASSKQSFVADLYLGLCCNKVFLLSFELSNYLHNIISWLSNPNVLHVWYRQKGYKSPLIWYHEKHFNELFSQRSFLWCIRSKYIGLRFLLAHVVCIPFKFDIETKAQKNYTMCLSKWPDLDLLTSQRHCLSS